MDNDVNKNEIKKEDVSCDNKEFKDILEANNVNNENANVDEYSFSGRKHEASSYIFKKYALEHLISKDVKDAYDKNYIYIHDLDSYCVGEMNCLFGDFGTLLKTGFKTRNADVRPARSISTAMQLLVVAMQIQSLSQFGGIGDMHVDYDLAPFVGISFQKHFKDGLKYVAKFSDEKTKSILDTTEIKINNYNIKTNYPKVYKYAIDMLEKEGKQSAQGLFHNLSTLQSRGGEQLPFSSLNFGTDTTPEGRLVTKWLLEASIEGIGKYHRTPIFPISIFQYKKGVNANVGDPNYDLKLLAIKSLSKRIYPNFVNCDWSQNKEIEGNPDTLMATMGALSGNEHLYVKINNNLPIDISIKNFFNYCKTGKLDNYRTAQIWYNKELLNQPACHKYHPQKTNLPTKAGVYKITYIPQDITYIGSSRSISRRICEHRLNIRKTGGLDAGCNFQDTNIDNYKFEVLELTDDYQNRENYYIEKIANVNVRGTSQRYYKSIYRKYNKKVYDRPNFNNHKEIPQDFIDLSNFDIKVLDRNNTWIKVKHIFKNDKYNTPLMMHIMYKENNKEYCLSCTEDHPLWNGKEFVKAGTLTLNDNLYRADNKILPITDISWHSEPIDSYDIGTESGTFIGSDIIMHNCRTMLGRNRFTNTYSKVGRGNISPITIVLPKLAIESKGNVDLFFKKLDEILKITEKGLVERFNYIAKQSPKSALFTYSNDMILDSYKCKDTIYESVKNGTQAIGLIGLAETLQSLIGKNQLQPEGLELGKKIIEHIYNFSKEASERNNLNFSCYYSPAENSCYTIMQKLQKEFGQIKNITDHNFLTNSIHIPVWEKIDIFEKIDIESQFTKYGTGGNIMYTEFDSKVKDNLTALEKVIDYAMNKDMPYFAINFPINNCLDCGYSGDIDNCCPVCGSGHIERLARVTGYLSVDISDMNEGKQEEVALRYKHSLKTKFGN